MSWPSRRWMTSCALWPLSSAVIKSKTCKWSSTSILTRSANGRGVSWKSKHFDSHQPKYKHIYINQISPTKSLKEACEFLSMLCITLGPQYMWNRLIYSCSTTNIKICLWNKVVWYILYIYTIYISKRQKIRYDQCTQPALSRRTNSEQAPSNDEGIHQEDKYQ